MASQKTTIARSSSAGNAHAKQKLIIGRAETDRRRLSENRSSGQIKEHTGAPSKCDFRGAYDQSIVLSVARSFCPEIVGRLLASKSLARSVVPQRLVKKSVGINPSNTINSAAVDASANRSSEAKRNTRVAKVSKLKGRNTNVAGSSLITSTKTTSNAVPRPGSKSGK